MIGSGWTSIPSSSRALACTPGAVRMLDGSAQPPKCCETVRRVAQCRLEGPNPEADQTPLHPVDQARALTDERLALTARALGILLRQRWNGRHVAVVGFAAQPADEDTFEQSRVEAICFG